MKLLTSLLLITAGIYGQAQAQGLFAAGVVAGANMSTLVVDDDADYSYTPGFHVGGFLELTVGKIGLQADVQYSRQGAIVKSGGEESDLTATFINVPVVFKYTLIRSVSINIGPQVSFLTCLESEYHPIAQAPFQEQDYTKAYKKTDIGASIGAGFNPTDKLVVNLRYVIGLTDINDYDGVPSTKTRLLQLSVGYKLLQF